MFQGGRVILTTAPGPLVSDRRAPIDLPHAGLPAACARGCMHDERYRAPLAQLSLLLHLIKAPTGLAG